MTNQVLHAAFTPTDVARVGSAPHTPHLAPVPSDTDESTDIEAMIQAAQNARALDETSTCIDWSPSTQEMTPAEAMAAHQLRYSGLCIEAFTKAAVVPSISESASLACILQYTVLERFYMRLAPAQRSKMALLFRHLGALLQKGFAVQLIELAGATSNRHRCITLMANPWNGQFMNALLTPGHVTVLQRRHIPALRYLVLPEGASVVLSRKMVLMPLGNLDQNSLRMPECQGSPDRARCIDSRSWSPSFGTSPVEAM